MFKPKSIEELVKRYEKNLLVKFGEDRANKYGLCETIQHNIVVGAVEIFIGGAFLLMAAKSSFDFETVNDILHPSYFIGYGLLIASLVDGIRRTYQSIRNLTVYKKLTN